MFILTTTAIELIQNNPSLRALLEKSLQVSTYTIIRYLRENEPNGDLTKFAALQIIQQETDLKIDDILSEVVVEDKVQSADSISQS